MGTTARSKSQLVECELWELSRIFSYTWSKDDFEMGTPLGKGKFGRVFIAREKKTKFQVAMKILFKSELVKGRVEKQGESDDRIPMHLA